MRTYYFLFAAMLCACSPGDGVLEVVDTDTGVETTTTGTGTGTGTGSAQLTWTTVSTGAFHACALDSDGAATCWGRDTEGETTPPEDVVFTDISLGSYRTCALNDAGYVHCWGKYMADAPTEVLDAVALASQGACGIRGSDGALTCWGDDGVGAGILLPPEGSFESIALGHRNGCALDSAGAATCWGDLDNGVVGGEPNVALSTVAVGGSATSTSTACGIRASDGGLTCWGQPDYVGGEPDGSFVDVVIAPIGFYACALDTDGTVQCWGDDITGEPEGTFDTLSGGIDFACASNDDTIVCWGDDSDGQVGLVP